MKVEERLAALGISLPDPKAPVANHLGTKQSGATLHVSVRVSEQKELRVPQRHGNQPVVQAHNDEAAALMNARVERP